MKNETKQLATFITAVVLALVANTGFLVDYLELPVLQGGGLWMFYAVSGATFVVSVTQLFFPTARGGTKVRLSTLFLLLLASISAMLQVWVVPLLAVVSYFADVGGLQQVQPSVSEKVQAPERRYRTVLSSFGLLLTVTIVVYVVQQDYQDQINRQLLEQELAQERAAVVEIQRLGGRFTNMNFDSGEHRVTSVVFTGFVKSTDGKQVITESRINDEGMVHLKALTELESLEINGANVTDAGLAHLRGLTRLRSLKLEGTRITEAGVGELQKALPNCRVIR